MSQTSERIGGMLVFTIVVVFFLWYVDYFGFGNLSLVGFGTNPYGYGSFVYKLLDDIFRNESYTSTNFLWVVTQVLPLLFSWPFRKQLGRMASYMARVAERIYKAV